MPRDKRSLYQPAKWVSVDENIRVSPLTPYHPCSLTHVTHSHQQGLRELEFSIKIPERIYPNFITGPLVYELLNRGPTCLPLLDGDPLGLSKG